MDNPIVTDHPVHEILAKRWSPRAFADKAVSAEDLGGVLEGARWAASSFNEQPWRYIVATRDNPAEFARVLNCLVPANIVWAQHAPVLMLGIVKTHFTLNGHPNGVAFHDLGAASTSMALEATARGLVVHQMGGILPDKAREEFAIPEGFTALTAIALGYAGEPDTLPEPLRGLETAPRTRKPLTEIAFGGAWGQPAEAVRI
jgi:nitroreductase